MVLLVERVEGVDFEDIVDVDCAVGVAVVDAAFVVVVVAVVDIDVVGCS